MDPGTAPIRILHLSDLHLRADTAWIIRHGEDFPRLPSCYVV